MSKYLAPIHEWLFDKILLLEGIEKEIHQTFQSNDPENHVQKLLDTMGYFVPCAPLEELIDLNNIHGWLQSRINIAETRQAAYIHFLLKQNPSIIEQISTVYYSEGEKKGLSLASTVNSPTEIYKALNDSLLEGMPCDRVNSIIEQTPEKLIWNTITCVHKNNWESNGVDVQIYYRLRASFIEGFVNGINKGYTYTYISEPIQQHHIVTI